MEESVFIVIRAGKVIGKPCYSLARLCKNLGIKKLDKKELPYVTGDFSISCHEIDKRVI